MDSPLTFIFEYFIKKFLQDYIEKDSLVLDSFSLFETSLNLKNIELKEQSFNKNGITIKVLSGVIVELSIEGALLETKLSVELNNISLTLFIDSIDHIIYPHPKPPFITKDPSKEFSFQKNQINSSYDLLEHFSVLKVKMSNVKLTVFTVIEGVLLHFTLLIGEVNAKPSTKEKTFKQADFASMSVKVINLDLSINFSQVDNLISVANQIAQGKEDIYQSCHLIENTSINAVITSGKLRFEREERRYPTPTPNENNGYAQYENFASFERNNELIIELKENNIFISDTLITNCMVLYKSISNKKTLKRALLLSGSKKLHRIVNSLTSHNQSKPNGYQFKTPASEKGKRHLTIIKYLTYIGLIMKQRKLIDIDISFYLCEKLVTEYRNNILKEAHYLIDYLINENIGAFLESPPIAGKNSIFLNMQLFSSLKASSKTNTLKGFMLFILQKFIICTECLRNYSSYDDFLFVNFKVERLNVSLIRSLKNISNDDNSSKNGLNGNRDKSYLNKLESTVRSLRSQLSTKALETSNVLFKLEIFHNSLSLYTNLKEHYLLKIITLKLYIYDISYRKLTLNAPLSQISPIFKLEYQAEVSLYAINSAIDQIIIDIPSFIVMIDPFCLYFIVLYAKSIQHSLSLVKGKDEEQVGTAFTPNHSITSKESGKEKRFEIKNLTLRINLILITFTQCFTSNDFENSESIAFQMTKIDFSLAKDVKMLIKFSIGELLLGTIINYNLIKFLSYEQTLWFETNIFNMFEISQVIELSTMQKEGLVIPFSNIVIELRQKDLYNFYKLYVECLAIFRFLPVFDPALPLTRQFSEKCSNGQSSNENEQGDHVSPRVEKDKKANAKTASSLFISLIIEKILVNVILNDSGQASSFRHIISIIQDISLIHLVTEDCVVSSVGFNSIKSFERQGSSELNELLSSKCEFPLDLTLLNKENFIEIHDAMLKLDEQSSNANGKLSEIGKYEGYVMYSETKQSKRIISSLPHLSLSFDYNLLRCVTQFLNFKGSTDVLSQIAVDLLAQIQEDFPGKYQIKRVETKADRLQGLVLSTNSSELSASFKVSSAKLILYEQKAVFLEGLLEQFTVAYQDKAITFNAIVKSICDLRDISHKKKVLLSKKSSAFPNNTSSNLKDKDAQALKLSIVFKIAEKSLKITVDNPRLIFLMRITLDIVEYFYKIIFLDILESTDYSALFDKSKPIKQRVEAITEQNPNIKTVKAFQNKKFTSISILNKSNRTGGKHRKITMTQSGQSMMQEKEKVKMKVAIVVTNFEVALCMNSLKDEELILSGTRFDFSTVLDSDSEETVLNYFNAKKANQQVQFDMTKVNFFCKVNGVKVRKIIERNTANMKLSEISIINMKRDISFNSNFNALLYETIGNVMVLIESVAWDKILSTMKIIVLIPYMKIKLYTDIYEELLRIVFENLSEARTIISQSSILSREYFDVQVHDYDDCFKKYTIANDIIVFNEESHVNVYNYPSKCTIHKIDKKNRQHAANVNCDFSQKNPSIEIDKMCQIDIDNLYTQMRFYNSAEKSIFVSVSDLSTRLNRYLKPFEQYTSFTLIQRISDKKEGKEVIRSELASPKVKNAKMIEVIPMKNNSVGEVNEWCVLLDMSIKKNEPMVMNMTLNKLQINFCQLPLIALYNFFSRYFFYYKNKRVKNVDHNALIRKRLAVNLTNSTVLMKANRSDSQQLAYEVQLDFDIKFSMSNDGNTCIGPFTSLKEYTLDIKSGFLNSIKEDNLDLNLMGGPRKYSGQNQFLDNFKLIYSTFAKCDEKWQDKDRYVYSFIKYGDMRSSVVDVAVTNDSPRTFRDYIRLFKFREDEEIPINMSYNDSLNNNEALLEYNNSHQEDINNIINPSGIIVNADEDADENSILTSHKNSSISKRSSDKSKGTIHISLSLCQLFRLKKIFEDLNRNYSDYTKYLIASTSAIKLNEITYQTYFGFYLSDIEVRICDSQFNAQLFQVVITKLMGLRNNMPDNPKLIEGLKKLMKNYEYSAAEPHDIDDKEFIDDTLVKFLLKINYHNSNQSKKKEDLEMFLPQLTKSDEKGSLTFWEPFIEPLPAKFTYLASEKNQHIKFDILSLVPSYHGARAECRQKKFHSLNINLNERLMEIFNLLLKDYERTKEVSKNKDDLNQKSISKTLTVKNLTEYEMSIDTKDNLEEVDSGSFHKTIIEESVNSKEEDEEIHLEQKSMRSSDQSSKELQRSCNADEPQLKNVFHFVYQSRKRINDKDEIYVSFINSTAQAQAQTKHDREGSSILLEKRKKFNQKNSEIGNALTQIATLRRGWKTYNIERPCKYFNIQKISKNQSNLNLAEERDELRKNFDNKASILLKGEHFLVCEIEINSEGNKKLVTFRSNEGIKNELDFPIKIIFVVKDKVRKSDMKIVLNPGQYFYMPPLMLDNIKEIQFKPVAFGNKLIHFGCESFPYNETSLRQDESNQEKIFIARCPIKEVRTYNEMQKQVPYNDHIVFCIVKKSEKIENEFLDEEIKHKIEFIRSYQKYNYDRSNKADDRQNDISKIISDTIYVLTPIMRFHNYLPRELTIEKRIPADFQSKKVKESLSSIANYFDIENYFKMEKEARHSQVIESDCKQYQYTSIQKCSIDYDAMRKNKNCYFDYSNKTLVKPGEYMSIYEPFILNEKGQNHLHYYIEVNEDNSLPIYIQHSSKKDKDKRKALSFDIKPFYFPTILKAIKQTETGNSFIGFPKILKANINKCLSENARNYFFNTLEVTENRVLNSFLFCPFLFLNCSDMNLEIKYQRYVKSLPGHKKSAVDYSVDRLHKHEMNRIIMFSPTVDGRFAFEMGHVTLQSDGNSLGIADDNKKDELISQWEKIQIFNISKYGGITVDLTSKAKKASTKALLKQIETMPLVQDSPHETHQSVSNRNTKKSNSMPVEEKDKKLTFSLQMQLLPKYSTLILITSSIYIGNHSQKDIYVYHLPMNKSLPIKSFVLKAMTSTKFHYLINYYPYVQLSFEDKYINNDKRNFSGLINFSLDEVKNKEFFVALGDPKKEPLLAIKIYEEKGFKFVLLTQREDINEYPFVIVNKLGIPITYKQKESLDDEGNEINVIYAQLEKDLGLAKRIVPLTLKEYHEANQPHNNMILNMSRGYPNCPSENLSNISQENKTYYTWEEPLLYDKEKNCNILEIILFGSKFEIDPQEIQKDVSFLSRVNKDNKLNYTENINDESISKGKIRITEKKHEYQYELYKHTLILKSTAEKEALIFFELHDKSLICERNYNGNFTMKSGLKEYEMYCVSIDETNNLVEKIFAFSRKAKEFADEFVIKKYPKNKCIYIEITKKKDIMKSTGTAQQTHLYFNIENVGIALMFNHVEFMYVWLRTFYSYIQKEYANEKDKVVLYREIVLKLKDYQIDNYSNHSYYPVILSPLSDKSYDPNFKEYCNAQLVINNFQMGTELYQVELIYANFTPIDLRFENKFLENISAFANKMMICFNNRKTSKDKTLLDYVKDVDSHNFIESNKLMASETRIHVKKFCIDDIKICFSLKFDNIDLFLQTRSFLFLKPLIEELGLRILNLDSTIFAFPNYTKNNISQSTDDFIQMIVSFLYQQFFSELVKALGGISSITSMQILENFNNNILSNMKGNDNSLDRYRTKKGFKEFYKTGYENISTVVGGIFILVYKMMATAGRIFASLSLDEKYIKERSYVINKSVKSLSNGLQLSFQVLMCALFYMFAQFYYIPQVYFQNFHWVLALLFTIIIILIGIVWKPICGVFDCLTKSLETIGVSINDILAERVKIYARFPRKIKENNLFIYNSLEALAFFAQACIDMQHDKTKTKDICLAVPGLMGKKQIIVLMTLDRLMIVEYRGELLFKELLVIHFSTFELFSADSDANALVIGDDNEERGRGHDDELSNRIQQAREKKYNMIQFEKNGNVRLIHVYMNRKGCFDFYGKNYEIKLVKMNSKNNLTVNYDNFINTIVKKKK